MDQETLFRTVIEMGKDLRYMRDDVSDLKRDLKENIESNEENMKLRDAKIARIEEIQNLNTGKLAVVLVLIGASVLGIFQFILMLWGKMPK